MMKVSKHPPWEKTIDVTCHWPKTFTYIEAYKEAVLERPEVILKDYCYPLPNSRSDEQFEWLYVGGDNDE